MKKLPITVLIFFLGLLVFAGEGGTSGQSCVKYNIQYTYP